MFRSLMILTGSGIVIFEKEWVKGFEKVRPKNLIFAPECLILNPTPFSVNSYNFRKKECLVFVFIAV
jgi:hypothetical protein